MNVMDVFLVVLPVPNPVVRKSTPPDLRIRSEFLLRLIGEATFDELNRFFERSHRGDKQVKMVRHQNKLMFGCDCSCSDGRGGGQTNPSSRLHGQCIARATLADAQRMSKPEVFAKIRWGNATKLLGIPNQA